MDRISVLIERWDPNEDALEIFDTDGESQIDAQGSSDYFLSSADKIHFFLEKSALDDNGRIKYATHQSYNESYVPISLMCALRKCH